jgi:phosphoribosylamine--glycine ligase
MGSLPQWSAPSNHPPSLLDSAVVKVLVVGSGGREHALAWKLAQSPALEELHAAPGNPGIGAIGRCHPIRMDDVEGLLGLCREHELDLVVIGPEAPLVAGVADDLRRAGVAVFGPGAKAARIEGSKAFAKELMQNAGVPTAAELAEARAPCVVKADGLAAGKGVFVCRTQAEADEGWRRAQAFGGAVVVEELLEGEEVSLFALTDGVDALPVAPAQDFKRLLDGDEGPNTGGMGSYSPVPFLAADEVEELVESIHRPVITELARRGSPFIGLLYAGLMLTEDGPRVLEFNCRFGDPECQTLMARLGSDLLPLLLAAARGEALTAPIAWRPEASVCVTLASGGYPGRYATGVPIDGLDAAEAVPGVRVFHAGTAERDGKLVTAGGRVLGVTATAPALAQAVERAYQAVGRIRFDGLHYRRDIGRKGIG